MSQTSSHGQRKLTWDPDSRQYFWYDERIDKYIFQNGVKKARHGHIPQTTIVSASASDHPDAHDNANSTSVQTTPLDDHQDTQGPRDGASFTDTKGKQDDQGTSVQPGSSQQSPAVNDYFPRPIQAKVISQHGRDMLQVEDERTLVKTTYQSGPANAITDPVLFQQGISARRYLHGSNDDPRESLFASFRQRDQPKRFFTIGKVFVILWVEPMEGTQITSLLAGESLGRFGERVFSKVRRFIVIREGDNYCTCLPIMSYGHRGVGKPGVIKSDHSIVYTTKKPPKPIPTEFPGKGEDGMQPCPIRIDTDDPIRVLDISSRIDYGKPHTVQHNLKVKSFGKVSPKSMSTLLHQFGNVWNIQPPPVTLSAYYGEANDKGTGPSERHSIRHRMSGSVSAGRSTELTSDGEDSDDDDHDHDHDTDDEYNDNYNSEGQRELMPEARARIRSGDSLTMQPEGSIVDGSVMQTDSGYHTDSIPDKMGVITSARYSFEDAASVKTDNESLHMPEDMKRQFVNIFAGEIFAGFDFQNSRQKQNASRMIGLLPDLLKNFTVLKKDRAKTKPEERAAIFVRHTRNAICGELNDLLGSSDGEVFDSDGYGMDFKDKIDDWHFDPHTATEDTESSEILESLEISEARHFLLEGDEYNWLVSRLQSAITMNSIACRNLSKVHNSFFAGLPREKLQEDKQDRTMYVELDWNPREYLLQQFDSIVDLGSTIVIVCHQLHIFAATCQQYLMQVWPALGSLILMAVQEFASSNGIPVQASVKDTLLRLEMVGNKTRITATGSLVALDDVFECIVWMATACRASPFDDTISTCEPSVTRVVSWGMTFRVDLDVAEIEPRQRRQTNDSCWHAMFRNPVIADGYPVPIRYENETGLEVAAEMMTMLAQTFTVVCFRGHLLLKGFNSMLAPTNRANESIQWHLIVNEDGQRLSYNEGVEHSKLSSYKEAFFPGARHFVGWSRSITVVSVTSEAFVTKVGWSDSEELTAGLAVDAKLSLQAGNFVHFGLKIVRGKKDTPLHFRPSWYDRQIRSASNWNVLFSDTGTRRHWLLDGATTIIFLLKMILQYVGSDVSDRLWHSHSSCLLDASRKFLLRGANRKIIIPGPTEVPNSGLIPEPEVVAALNDSEKPPYTLQDLFQESWCKLEALYDDVPTPKNPETIDINWRSRIHRGYELNDIVEGESVLKPRFIQLKEPARVWYQLVHRIETINLFASGLEELIRPRSDDAAHYHSCGLEKRLPDECLAVPMSILKNVNQKYPKHTKRSVHLAEDLYWTDPAKSFHGCPQHDSDSLRCAALIKELSPRPHINPGEGTSRVHSIFEEYPNGAVIMGRCPEKLHKHQSSLTSTSTGHSLSNVRSSDSGIDMNSQASPGAAAVEQSSTGSASTSNTSNRRRRVSSWFRRHSSTQGRSSTRDPSQQESIDL